MWDGCTRMGLVRTSTRRRTRHVERAYPYKPSPQGWAYRPTAVGGAKNLRFHAQHASYAHRTHTMRAKNLRFSCAQHANRTHSPTGREKNTPYSTFGRKKYPLFGSIWVKFKNILPRMGKIFCFFTSICSKWVFFDFNFTTLHHQFSPQFWCFWRIFERNKLIFAQNEQK